MASVGGPSRSRHVWLGVGLASLVGGALLFWQATTDATPTGVVLVNPPGTAQLGAGVDAGPVRVPAAPPDAGADVAAPARSSSDGGAEASPLVAVPALADGGSHVLAVLAALGVDAGVPKRTRPVEPARPALRVEDVVKVKGRTCPGGAHVTLAEARALPQVCQLLGDWDIVWLAGGASMDGPGYGCKSRPNEARDLGDSLCRR